MGEMVGKVYSSGTYSDPQLGPVLAGAGWAAAAPARPMSRCAW